MRPFSAWPKMGSRSRTPCAARATVVVLFAGCCAVSGPMSSGSGGTHSSSMKNQHEESAGCRFSTQGKGGGSVVVGARAQTFSSGSAPRFQTPSARA
jgi:hypothetical protein